MKLKKSITTLVTIFAVFGLGAVIALAMAGNGTRVATLAQYGGGGGGGGGTGGNGGTGGTGGAGGTVTVTTTTPAGTTTTQSTATTPGTTPTTPGEGSGSAPVDNPGNGTNPDNGTNPGSNQGGTAPAGAAGAPGGTRFFFGGGAAGAPRRGAPTPRRVGILFLGTQTNKRVKLIISSVRRAAQMAGMQVAWTSVLRQPVDVKRLANAAKGTDFAGLKPSTLTPFSTQIGRQLMRPASLLQKERDAMFSPFVGVLQPLTGIAIAHDPNPKLAGRAQQNRDAVFSGLFKGLKATKLPVVGVETTKRAPKDTTLPFFERYGLPSFVDNVDQASGRQALSQLFQGAAAGHYGTKKGAKAKVPSTAPVSVGN